MPWQGYFNSQKAQLQYLEGDAVRAMFARRWGVNNVHIQLFDVGEAAAHIVTFPQYARFEIEAGRGDPRPTLTGVGFFLQQTDGGVAFSSGTSDYDEDDEMEVMRELFAHFEASDHGSLWFWIEGRKFVFSLNEADLRALRTLYEPEAVLRRDRDNLLVQQN